MKLTVLIFLVILSLSSYGNEKLIDDKGIDVFDEIVSRWSNYYSGPFDTVALGNTLIAGRCYSKNNKSPWGSALVVEQRKVDNGPIGTPSDYISFGQMLWAKPANSFDTLNYLNFKYLTQNGTIKEDLSEFSSSTYAVDLNAFSIKYNNGMYYAVYYTEDLPGQRNFLSACYYFSNNN